MNAGAYFANVHSSLYLLIFRRSLTIPSQIGYGQQ